MSAVAVENGTASAPPGQAVRGRRYCLIIPCRDEAKFARTTLESIVHQTVTPALVVVVDDGSRDETPELLGTYAQQYPYIRVIRREDRGYRKLGGGVIDAFYEGYNSINPADFDYVCKLDLDLDLPRDYFEKLMEMMEADPRLGTVSGKPYFEMGGRRVSEKCGDENSVGMAKFYRTGCFEQIGGFVRELMWDGIDGHRCRMLGWKAASVDLPSLRFTHLRPMGTSHKNWWTGRVRHGYGQYFMGTGPVYMTASAIFRMTRPPIFIGGVAMLWGYWKSLLARRPRYADGEFRKFVRRYQRDCLVMGKRGATRKWEELMRESWKADRVG